MTRFILLFLFLLSMGALQQSALAQKASSLDLNFSLGKTEGALAFSFNQDFGLGKNRKMIVGWGTRFTSYLGKNKYYVTAPAELTSGGTGPGVLFKENIIANMDTFLIQTPRVNALNLLVTLGYNFSSKLMVRFNIDAIGFSFGKSVRGNYINGSQGAMESASPTPFNLLLVSDNDRGTLNSELFVKYLFNERWGVKGGLQFLFTEYTTNTAIQQLPDPNDRFRKKSLMFMIGVSHKLTHL